jgi:hypothetical protein
MVVYFWFHMLKAIPTFMVPLAFTKVLPLLDHIKLQHFHCLAQRDLFLHFSFSLPSMVLCPLFAAHAPLFSLAPVIAIAFSSPLTPLLLLSYVFPHLSNVFYLLPTFRVLLSTVTDETSALHLLVSSYYSSSQSSISQNYSLKVITHPMKDQMR